MKIEVELSDVQLKAVETVAGALRTNPAEALTLLAFAQMMSDFGDRDGLALAVADVAIPVIHGELPKFPAKGICGCIAFDEAAPDHVSLSPAELRKFIRDLTGEIYGNLVGPDVEESDPAGVVAEWRRQSPHYVERSMRDPNSSMTRELYEDVRRETDEAAEMLERLLKATA